MPVVSIIIPAHNPGRFLREAILSVCRQRYTDWELIVIDDNSSEDLSWLGEEFPQVRLIRQAHGGVSVARNNGILNSSGTFIAFMDQDDVWLPHKLRRQVAAMEAVADAALCYCGLDLIDSDGKMLTESTPDTRDLNGPIGDEFDREIMVELDGASEGSSQEPLSKLHRSIRHFSSHFIPPSTVMLRRSCLATSGLLDPFIPFSGDYDLIIKLGSRHKVVRIPNSDVRYRKHANNYSDQYEVGRQEVEALIARYVAYAHSQGDAALARSARQLFGRPAKMYAAQAFDRARRSLSARDFRSTSLHLWRAFCFHPAFVVGSLSRWCGARWTRQDARTRSHDG